MRYPGVTELERRLRQAVGRKTSDALFPYLSLMAGQVVEPLDVANDMFEAVYRGANGNKQAFFLLSAQVESVIFYLFDAVLFVENSIRTWWSIYSHDVQEDDVPR